MDEMTSVYCGTRPGLSSNKYNNDVSCIVQHFAAARVVAPVLCVQILWIDLELYLVSFVLFVTGVEQELLLYEALTRPYKTCLCVCVCVCVSTDKLSLD